MSAQVDFFPNKKSGSKNSWWKVEEECEVCRDQTLSNEQFPTRLFDFYRQTCIPNISRNATTNQIKKWNSAN